MTKATERRRMKSLKTGSIQPRWMQERGMTLGKTLSYLNFLPEKALFVWHRASTQASVEDICGADPDIVTNACCSVSAGHLAERLLAVMPPALCIILDTGTS